MNYTNKNVLIHFYISSIYIKYLIYDQNWYTHIINNNNL